MRIAFCGNGFIHLNIAEIHEEINWGPEKVCVFWQSGLKMSDFAASQRMSPENIKGFSKRCPGGINSFGVLRIGENPWEATFEAGIGVPTRAISKKSNYYRKQISSLVGQNP